MAKIEIIFYIDTNINKQEKYMKMLKLNLKKITNLNFIFFYI